MKNVTKLAKRSAGLSQKCSICPLMKRCTLEIQRACFDSFVDGFKKGARAAEKEKKQEIQNKKEMKQTVEEAARGYSNDCRNRQRHCEPYCIVDFISGAEWQSKQSPWISVEDKLPSLNQKVIVYNGKQVYISHRTEKDYAKDTNSFLYGLQTYNVVAWMPIPSFDEILEANKDVLDWEFEIDDFQDE